MEDIVKSINDDIFFLSYYGPFDSKREYLISHARLTFSKLNLQLKELNKVNKFNVQ